MVCRDNWISMKASYYICFNNHLVIYTSCIEQFWATAKVQTVNEVRQLQALVDKKRVSVTESSIRRDLHLDDAEGTNCLPTATIFEELARMGYEKPSQKLTFYKAFFSPQWKYYILTITQCLSVKPTAWNEFSSSMASLIICLATNQKFNLSKYIFDAMVKHLDGGVKFLLYPCFLQVFINQQLEMGEDSNHLTDSTPIHIIDQPSSSSQPKKDKPSKKAQRQSKVLDLQKSKDAQAKEIAALQKRIQRLERRKMSRPTASKKPDDSTAGEAVTTTSIDDSVVPTTSEEITLAQTLIQIKAAKPKVVTTTATTTTTTRPKDREVVVQEPKQNYSKENKKKKPHSIDLNAKKAKPFMELMEKRRKHFAALRAQEKRNIPLTKAHSAAGEKVYAAGLQLCLKTFYCQEDKDELKR
ncbi:hypothetical protein Tco_0950750 [Tanacetum coccineum]